MPYDILYLLKFHLTFVTFVFQYMQLFLAKTRTPQYHPNEILTNVITATSKSGIAIIVCSLNGSYLLLATWSAYTNVAFNQNQTFKKNVL